MKYLISFLLLFISVFAGAQGTAGFPFTVGGGGGVVDSTRLVQDSITVYFADGVEIGRDTVRTGSVSDDQTASEVEYRSGIPFILPDSDVNSAIDSLAKRTFMDFTYHYRGGLSNQKMQRSIIRELANRIEIGGDNIQAFQSNSRFHMENHNEFAKSLTIFSSRQFDNTSGAVEIYDDENNIGNLLRLTNYGADKALNILTYPNESNLSQAMRSFVAHNYAAQGQAILIDVTHGARFLELDNTAKDLNSDGNFTYGTGQFFQFGGYTVDDPSEGAGQGNMSFAQQQQYHTDNLGGMSDKLVWSTNFSQYPFTFTANHEGAGLVAKNTGTGVPFELVSTSTNDTLIKNENFVVLKNGDIYQNGVLLSNTQSDPYASEKNPVLLTSTAEDWNLHASPETSNVIMRADALNGPASDNPGVTGFFFVTIPAYQSGNSSIQRAEGRDNNRNFERYKFGANWSKWFEEGNEGRIYSPLNIADWNDLGVTDGRAGRQHFRIAGNLPNGPTPGVAAQMSVYIITLGNGNLKIFAQEIGGFRDFIKYRKNGVWSDWALEYNSENFSGDGLGTHLASQDVDANNFKVINLATPTAPADATTKNYVDTRPVVQSLTHTNFDEPPVAGIKKWFTVPPALNGKTITQVLYKSAANQDGVDGVDVRLRYYNSDGTEITLFTTNFNGQIPANNNSNIITGAQQVFTGQMIRVEVTDAGVTPANGLQAVLQFN